ncbi:hypothetical protein ACFORL_06270 [Legionella dresdenensis]|uniref:Cupin domain protein n=1 Tax=Legionella dresdenensis TaxID=450200 RepID=A0ABV8CET9_9GAMM
MKKYITLYSGTDNKSYFKEEEHDVESIQHLGAYSARIPATGFKFRMFKAGLEYNWHNPPQPQYIIYLNGEVEVEASGGEKRVFKSGDVLFANDMVGQGHITRTLTDGNSIIVTTQDEQE